MKGIYNKVKDYLESTGCNIIEHSDDLQDDISGQTRYLLNEIHLNCATYKEALFTIIHEGGHWLSYLDLRDKSIPKMTKDQKEKLAHDYGWKLIIDLDIPISKDQWDIEDLN